MKSNTYAENALQPEWTEKQISFLKEQYCFLSAKQLMVELNRSIVAIQQKANQLGLRKTHSWTEEELILLKEKYVLATTEELISLFRHSLGSINKKAKKLGLKRKNITSPQWTTEELDMLYGLVISGFSDKEIAKKMDKRVERICYYRLYLKLPMREFWSEAENNLLYKFYAATDNETLSNMFINRSVNAVCKQAAILGLEKQGNWSPEEVNILREKYSNSIISELLILLPNKTKGQIKYLAGEYGLKKNLETLARCFRTEIGKIPELPGPLTVWRYKILKRDNFACADCGLIDYTGAELRAHHIVPRRDENCEKYNINNGICLCKGCHNKIHGKEYEYIAKYANIVSLK